MPSKVFLKSRRKERKIKDVLQFCTRKDLEKILLQNNLACDTIETRIDELTYEICSRQISYESGMSAISAEYAKMAEILQNSDAAGDRLDSRDKFNWLVPDKFALRRYCSA